MNLGHLALAFLGATVAYFVAGSILFVALPAMQSEFLKYPAVYRSKESMMKVMPSNMVGILISIMVATVLYAKIYPVGGSILPGLYFGAMIGLFSVCTYAVHNFTLLNIGLLLTLYESITYFIQWVLVGVALGLIYKPA